MANVTSVCRQGKEVLRFEKNRVLAIAIAVPYNSACLGYCRKQRKSGSTFCSRRILQLGEIFHSCGTTEMHVLFQTLRRQTFARFSLGARVEADRDFAGKVAW